MAATNTTRVSIVSMTPGRKMACPAGCANHSAKLHKAWAEADERCEVVKTMIVATKTRCGCGDCGDWSERVTGTSGGESVVWAGCGNCGGRAVGYPIPAKWWRKWVSLDSQTKLLAIARAATDIEGGKFRSVVVDADTLDSTLDYEMSLA